MKLISLRTFALGLLLSILGASYAEVPIPTLSTHVTDMTGTLSADQKSELESSLSAFEAKKGSQIAVLIVDTTAPEAIEQYSLRVVEQWKLGRKKVDDGALLIIAKGDRAMRIEVGYGLEGALNDAVSKRIISEIITPPFKQGDYFEGIRAGITSMMQVVDGEPLPAPTRGRQVGQGWGGAIPVLFIVVLAIGGVLRALLGRFPGAVVTGGVVALLAWAILGAISMALLAGLIAMVVTLFGGGMTGLAAGYYGGGGSRGGGGGFSGGGGSFGGGGASGRW